MKQRIIILLFGLGFFLGLFIFFGMTIKTVKAESVFQISPCETMLADAANRAGISADNVEWQGTESWGNDGPILLDELWSCSGKYLWDADEYVEFSVNPVMTFDAPDWSNYCTGLDDQSCEADIFHGNSAKLSLWKPVDWDNPDANEDVALEYRWSQQSDGQRYEFFVYYDPVDRNAERNEVMAIAEALWAAANEAADAIESDPSVLPPGDEGADQNPNEQNPEDQPEWDVPIIPGDPIGSDQPKSLGPLVTTPLVPLAGALIGTLVGWLVSVAATSGNVLKTLFAPPFRSAQPPSIAAGPETGNLILDIIQNNPQINGGPGDNSATRFDGGEGPARCSPSGGLPNYWVNTANLNLYVEDLVYTYRGLGPDIVLKLNYNSAPGNAGMFGRNWRFSYDSAIQQLPDRTLLWKGSGQRLGFRRTARPGGGNPNTPQDVVSLDGGRERLFDYGAYFLLIESEFHLRYRYDKSPGAAWARLTAIVDQNNNAVKLTYSPDGSLHSVTDAAGRVTSFVYDPNRRCVGFSLPDGRQAKYVYDGQGNLTQAIDLLGTTVLYEYDDKDSLTRMVVARDQKTTTFTYQDNGQGKYLAGVTDAAGNSVRYELLSVTPRHVRVTDPEGQPTSYYSMPQGYTERVVDPLGNTVVTGYANGLPVSFTNANQQTSRMEYDAYGNMIRLTDPLGAVWVNTYDNNDRLISKTDPLGAVWQYGYDARGNLVRSVSAQGRAFSREYDNKGQLIALVNAGGNKSTFAYDRFGNRTVVTHPLGDITKHAYDGYGLNRVATTDANGNTTKYEYDPNHRLTRLIHPDGTSRMYDYDCCVGTAVIDENGHKVSTKRDPLLQIMEEYDALGNANLFVYDRNMRQVKVQDPLGHTWKLAYDPAGRMVQWADPFGDIGRLAYDPEGNLTSLWDERGNKTGFVFDGNNQLTGTTDPLGHNQLYTRDTLGRLTAVTNARGGTVKVDYDHAGRVIEKSYDGLQLAAYEYDDLGNLIQMTDASGKTNFTFDGGNKVTSIRYPDALMVTYSYDPNGNLLTVTYPGKQVVRYVYDMLNRVTQMAWGQHSISYRYDAVGNVIGVSRSNAAQTAYEYDANNRLLKVTHQIGAQVFAELIYSRDQVGNIINESGVLPLQYQFEETPVPITYNDLNQIVRRGEEAYTYDADGNLIGIGMGRWQAKYDLENRPVEIVQNGRSRGFAYNGAGQRTLVDMGEGKRFYHHDTQGKLLFETDQSSNLIASYLYRDAYLVARVDALGAVLFYHFDKTGNTLALSDQAGEVVTAYGYAQHGAVINKFGEVDNPFTYVGEYGVMDDGYSLFYMRNRTYDALTGRFVQKDPLGFVEGTNLYTYVSNNPIRYIDPAGYFLGDVTSLTFWGGTLLGLVGAPLALIPPTTVIGLTMMTAGGGLIVYSTSQTAPPEGMVANIKNIAGIEHNKYLIQDGPEWGPDRIRRWKPNEEYEILSTAGQEKVDELMMRLNAPLNDPKNHPLKSPPKPCQP